MKFKDKPIKNYHDFVAALLEAGFSLGGGNAENIFALCDDNFAGTRFSEDIRWHTDDPETDPWEWRMRVLDERDDIAYSKVFFNKSGYITKEWYPYFLAARRGNMTLDEEYADGVISSRAKRIYNTILKNGALPMHAIKPLAGFGRDEKSGFERALVELQMKMYLTMCGTQQKISQKGEAYGWSSTVFCTTERFFGNEVFEKAAKLTEDAAIEKIAGQVLRLNPAADEKRILKFIKG